MDDLQEKIDETVESIVDVWLWIIGFIFASVVLLTSPIWLIPYFIIKYVREAREHDTSK